jgi:hypothetical protein
MSVVRWRGTPTWARIAIWVGSVGVMTVAPVGYAGGVVGSLSSSQEGRPPPMPAGQVSL